jgi:hypothetical protein
MWSAGALACDYDDVQIKHRLPKGRRFAFCLISDPRSQHRLYLSKNDFQHSHFAIAVLHSRASSPDHQIPLDGPVPIRVIGVHQR